MRQRRWRDDVVTGRHPAQIGDPGGIGGSLRSAAWLTLCCSGVQAVFKNIQIETAQIFRAEIVQLVNNLMKLVLRKDLR